MIDDDQNQAPHNRSDEALRTFEEQQERELVEFEEKQAADLLNFEEKERKDLEEFEAEQKHKFEIKVDRSTYEVHKEFMTGEEIRHLPEVPIGPERDLFEVVPGGADKKILNDMVVKIHDGLRFFTAPAQINPGCCKECCYASC